MPAPDGRVDLRSDTVTRPTPEMRRAMAGAEVGDDGFGDDPTTNELQEAFAQRVGKEAALFVPSGTMANQIALRLLGKPGTTLIIGRRQHPVIYEQGAFGVNQVAQLHGIDDDDGTIDAKEVAYLVEAAAHHWPTPSAVCIENSHLPSGGRVWPLEKVRAVAAVGLPMHLDGARLFNAEVATGVRAADIADAATTVMCCMSKGLAAPVGSLLAGPADLIDEARAERKRLGGGMRQVGILAAAGLYALHHHLDRLADDHARAQRLAAALEPLGVVDTAAVRTNLVLLDLAKSALDAPALAARAAEQGVLIAAMLPRTARLITHLDVDDAGVDRATEVLGSLLDGS
jgi:threonine aldolase